MLILGEKKGWQDHILLALEYGLTVEGKAFATRVEKSGFDLPPTPGLGIERQVVEGGGTLSHVCKLCCEVVPSTVWRLALVRSPGGAAFAIFAVSLTYLPETRPRTYRCGLFFGISNPLGSILMAWT